MYQKKRLKLPLALVAALSAFCLLVLPNAPAWADAEIKTVSRF